MKALSFRLQEPVPRQPGRPAPGCEAWSRLRPAGGGPGQGHGGYHGAAVVGAEARAARERGLGRWGTWEKWLGKWLERWVFYEKQWISWFLTVSFIFIKDIKVERSDVVILGKVGNPLGLQNCFMF